MLSYAQEEPSTSMKKLTLYRACLCNFNIYSITILIELLVLSIDDAVLAILFGVVYLHTISIVNYTIYFVIASCHHNLNSRKFPPTPISTERHKTVMKLKHFDFVHN